MGKRARPQPRLLVLFLSAPASPVPDQLGKVSLDTFYRAINKVARTLIRADADEVTYNLHVMLRSISS